MKSKISRSHPFAATALLALSTTALHAQTYNWSGPINATPQSWNVDANWSGTPDPFPNAVGDIATLTVDFQQTTIVNLNAATIIGALNLGDTVSEQIAPATSSTFKAVTLATGTGTNILTFDNTASTSATFTSIGASNTVSSLIQLNDNLEVTTTSGLTLSGIISETGGAKSLTKTNLGGSTFTALSLNGANTFTGGVTTQQGVVYLGNNNALGTGTITLPIDVRFSSATGIRNSFGSRNAAATIALLSGNIAHTGAAGANLFCQNAGATLAISGTISGIGGGTIRINDSYTYTSANAVDTLETPTGTVALTNTTVNAPANGITVVRGTLLVNGDEAANGTGGGTGRIAPTVPNGV